MCIAASGDQSKAPACCFPTAEKVKGRDVAMTSANPAYVERALPAVENKVERSTRRRKRGVIPCMVYTEATPEKPLCYQVCIKYVFLSSHTI